jgi:hypothetical protein
MFLIVGSASSAFLERKRVQRELDNRQASATGQLDQLLSWDYHRAIVSLSVTLPALSRRCGAGNTNSLDCLKATDIDRLFDQKSIL